MNCALAPEMFIRIKINITHIMKFKLLLLMGFLHRHTEKWKSLNKISLLLPRMVTQTRVFMSTWIEQNIQSVLVELEKTK